MLKPISSVLCDGALIHSRRRLYRSKDGESTRTLYVSLVIAVARARGLLKAGWRVHVVDAEGRLFHPEKFDQLLSFDRKPTRKF